MTVRLRLRGCPNNQSAFWQNELVEFRNEISGRQFGRAARQRAT
jgi:hypothetical protein